VGEQAHATPLMAEANALHVMAVQLLPRRHPPLFLGAFRHGSK
jgi:hypothetical protein